LAASDVHPILSYGVIAYRDHPPQDTTYITKVFDLSDDISRIQKNIDSIVAAGGGDEPEAVLDGIYDAIDNMGGGGTNEIWAIAEMVNQAEIRFLVEDANGVNTLPGGGEAIMQSDAIGNLSAGESNLEVYITSPGIEHSVVKILASDATCERDATCPNGCTSIQMEYVCNVSMPYYIEPGSNSGGDPYYVNSLLEFPITTQFYPIGLPFIGTSLIAFPSFLVNLMNRFVHTQNYVNLELHAIDLADKNDSDLFNPVATMQPDLKYSLSYKEQRIRETIQNLKQTFTFKTISEMVEHTW